MIPLSGIRVIDMARLGPGPHCAQILGDLGADVIKVESTEYADWFRPGSPERRAREALGIGVNQAMKPKAFKALTVGLR